MEPLLSYKLLIQQNRDHKKEEKKEEEQEQEEKEQQQQQELEPELHRESKKTRQRTLAHNFTKYCPIFKILSLLDSVGNL